ncbi:unnamed protein product, partial [Allacma fusca]
TGSSEDYDSSNSSTESEESIPSAEDLTSKGKLWRFLWDLSENRYW